MPFDEDNRIIFMTGPLTGLRLPVAAGMWFIRSILLTKSLQPRVCRGFWATELKRSGYDGIIVKGKAKKPVYLWVHDGKAEIRDAAQCGARTPTKTEDLLQDQIGPKACVRRLALPGKT